MSVLYSKLFLISAGVVSLAMGFKLCVPFTGNGILVIWSIILSWLEPPYLYVVINAIILIIIVSSRFHWSQSEPSLRSEHLISVKTPPPAYYESMAAQPEIASAIEESTAAAAAAVYDGEDRTVDVKAVVVNGSKVVFETDEAAAEVKDSSVDSTRIYDSAPEEIASPELQLEFLLPAREKPLVTSRFGHRKPVKTTPEGTRALRVARPKRQETLESTWKMITEGRHVPLTRHIRKSNSGELHNVQATATSSDHAAASESSREHNSNHAPPAAAAVSRIRKEPSQSQDELNRRFEAFIKKFNEDMRIQRQESLNQYREMMQRGL